MFSTVQQKKNHPSEKFNDDHNCQVQRSPSQGADLLEPLLRFSERLLGPDLEASASDGGEVTVGFSLKEKQENTNRGGDF